MRQNEIFLQQVAVRGHQFPPVRQPIADFLQFTNKERKNKNPIKNS